MRICITCDGISATDAERCAHCGGLLLGRQQVHVPIRRGEAEAAHPLIGSTIDGKYEIQGVLGRGGMGIVFRAVHAVSFVQVALKLLHRRFAARQEYRDWFLAEARKAGRVNHEHCARIQDVGTTDDGTVYIAMELAQGPPLSAWLVESRPIAPQMVVDVCMQVGRALVAAHDVGVVHRDLSPRNVVIAVRDGVPFVKILDFGIARGLPQRSLAGDADSSAGAPTGFANPAYAAPEVLVGAESGPEADLYSLGVVAFHMLMGRLPVRGGTPRELADATVAGRIESIPSNAPVPKRLAKLVNRLLAREPSDRPSSAREVLDEFERVRDASGSSAWVRAAAVLSATFGIGLTAAAFSGSEPQYLVPDSRSAFAFSALPDVSKVRVLRSEDLSELHFEHGGFDAAQLELVVSVGGREIESTPLSPRVRGAELQLSFEDPSYAEAVQRIASHSSSGPVDLVLQVPGRRPLAYSTVRIDDAPPLVSLEYEGERGVGAALIGSSRLRITTREDGGLRDFALFVNHGGEQLRLDRPPSTFDVASVLGDRFAGNGDLGAVELFVRAEDEAGNVGVSEPLRFEHFDLRAPQIVSVPSLVSFDGGLATVRIGLDSQEDGLAVSVRGPSGQLPVQAVTALGDRISITLAREQPDAMFTDGTYRIRVEDKWGNFSREFAENWRFVASDPGIETQVVSGRAARWGDTGFVADGSSAVVQIQCSGLYRLRSAWVVGEGHDAIDLAVTSSDAAFRVALPELPSGDYQLRLEFDTVDVDGTSVEGASIAEVKWFVRSDPPSVRIPDVGGARFLRELTDRAVFRRDGTGSLSAADWVWSVEDLRMLRGHVWLGDGTSMSPREFVRPGSPRGRVVRRVPLKRGVNVIGLELTDLLGRAVRVVRGDTPAPLCGGVGGRVVYEVARFHHDDEACSVVEPEVRIEFGHPARFALRCDLPLEPDDEVALLVGRLEIEPEPSETPARLEFLVPFDVLANAGGFFSVSEAEFRRQTAISMTVRLMTPAGGYDIELRLAPVVSSLVPVRLGSVFDTGVVELANLEFVPVLGPTGVHRDPVGPDFRARGLFRATPPGDVRNIEDVFLQRGEITRAQYDAIVRAGFMIVAGASDDLKARVVHASDPIGTDRLAVRRLIPRAYDEDAKAWATAVEDAPDRPVTGVDFFQAYTVVRLLGVVLAADPNMFRLPFGAELEVAALGGAASGRLNGTTTVEIDSFVAAVAEPGAGRAWPLTAAECAVRGDRVTTSLGYDLVGLDFGVREWVMDLPFSASARETDLLREWLSDHTRHVQRALEHAGSPASDPMLASPFFGRVGVVRGLAYGESGGLVDGRTGASVRGSSVPHSVPGVVRCHNLLRDGSQPASATLDPLLRLTGFRVCGGSLFVERVRRQR